jgi:hypothetical protein
MPTSDVNGCQWTSLYCQYWASSGLHFSLSKRSADVNARAGPDLEARGDVFTLLHRASSFGALEVQ